MDYSHRARAWTLVLETDSKRELRWRKATWKVRCHTEAGSGVRHGCLTCGLTNPGCPAGDDTTHCAPQQVKFPGVEDSQPRWPEPTRLWRPLPRPWAKTSTTTLGKGGDRVHMPNRPDRGLVAPHLRKPRDKATAWSPTRAATAAGCSRTCPRTCRLLLPGDVEGWRGPQNRVAAQLPERRGAQRRRPPNRPFRRRPRRPRGPSAWPRPSSVGRTRTPCVWRNHRLHAAGTTLRVTPTKGCGPSRVTWVIGVGQDWNGWNVKQLVSPPRPLNSSSLWNPKVS